MDMKENNFVCAYCGLAGYKKPSDLKRAKNNFCNRICADKFKDKRIEVKCAYESCENISLRAPWEIERNKNNFCSHECYAKFQDKKLEVECLNCGIKFMKQLCEIKTRKKHFCSELCAKNLQKFKDWSCNRSKLEIAIEKHFKIIFPFMYIRYNKTDIGYELDIFVPCLELAIELNGPLHYKAIFGEEELLKRQKTDREKVVECRNRDIKLFVIDVSKDRGEKIKLQRISEVKQIVWDRIIELDYVFENKQMVMEM
jgi:hypothetical protein